MTSRAAPLGIAMAILVLSIALAMVLIPILDQQLRRTMARKAAAEAVANDNSRAVAREGARRVG